MNSLIKMTATVNSLIKTDGDGEHIDKKWQRVSDTFFQGDTQYFCKKLMLWWGLFFHHDRWQENFLVMVTILIKLDITVSNIELDTGYESKNKIDGWSQNKETAMENKKLKCDSGTWALIFTLI